MEDSGKVAICGCCFVAIVIIAAVWVSWAFETISPIEYGIVYNTISKSIDTSKVYDGGWHYVGMTSSFLKFPATLQNVEFTNYAGADSRPITAARTQEGLSVTLHISFQYKLQKDKVGDLYSNFTNQYENTYITRARGAIIEESSKYNSAEYWTNRKVIGAAMKKLVNEELLKAFATCESLQILSIDFPQQREEAIINSQVTKEINNQKKQEQDAAEVRAEINVDMSQTQQKVTIIEGNAQASATRIINDASAFNKNLQITTQAEAYKKVGEATGQTPKDTLMDYIYYTEIQHLESPQLLLGGNRAMVGH